MSTAARVAISSNSVGARECTGIVSSPHQGEPIRFATEPKRASDQTRLYSSDEVI